MTKIKICGLKTKADVMTAVESGADFIGFVFAKSHRQVTPELVKEITDQVPATVKKVGVFVSPTRAEVQEAIAIAGLDLVQIHGTLTTGAIAVPVIRALSVKKDLDYTRLKEGNYTLLDAPPNRYMGGNGQQFDWQAVKTDHLPKERLFIAGGLDAQNVREAIRFFAPYAVDVSSGVETKQQKDPQKIADFCKAVKEENHVSTTR